MLGSILVRSCSSPLVFSVLLGLLSMPSQAQNYPSKPIRIVVGSVSGGSADGSARKLASLLAPAVGQPVIVDNRPGGAGVIAAQEVAKAAPDGHTILFSTISDITREFTGNAQFAASRFVVVTRLHSTGYVIVVNPSVPADSLKKLVELSKAKPGALSYSTSGSGGGASLYGVLFKHVAGVDMVEVPYKSLGAGLPDLMGGRIQAAFDTYASLAPHLKSGKIRALAVTQARRLGPLPDVPTVRESGLPDAEASISNYILAPKGTPQPVVQLLQQHFAKVLNTPEYRAFQNSNGQEPGGESPEESAALIRATTDKWGKLIKDTGYKME